jgi:4-hydroxy-tetrahydrodipicolinate reductase
MKTDRIRTVVSGARGKMGVVTIAALRAADDIEYVGGLVRGSAANADEYTSLGTLFERAKPHVLVDFTTYPASMDIALEAMQVGIRPVIGTSGYGAAEVTRLRAESQRTGIGCVFAPNFALGAVLMMRFARAAAPHFAAVEIVEMHESGKKDAPSGTAMATARAIAEVRTFDRAPTEALKADGARGADLNGIGVHSLRLPGVITHQEVRFGGEGETLAIVHDSSSRASFMPGVLMAVRAAHGLTRFVDGIGELL